MAKLEFIKNSIIDDKLSYEWPIGTTLRRVQESNGGTYVLNTGVIVDRYIKYCRGVPCPYCCSAGRVMGGHIQDGDIIKNELFCIGLDKRDKGIIEYWEEDK